MRTSFGCTQRLLMRAAYVAGKRRIAFAAAAAGVMVVTVAPSFASDTARLRALDAVVDSVAVEGVGVSVLLTDAKNVVYARSVGQADPTIRSAQATNLQHAPLPNSSRIVRRDDVWRWASVTKQVATVIVAQLVQENRLELDKPISAYLSSTAFSGASRERVTVRQLMQHLSGLPNPNDAPASGKNSSAHATTAATNVSADRLATMRVCSAPPKRAPGERFEYNNCDYLVLGAIIEHVSGKTFFENVHTRIAMPLGLTTLGAAETVLGYRDIAQRESTVALAAYGAAGALTGSIDDLAALNRALMGERLLSAETKKLFWTGVPQWGYAGYGVWAFPATLRGCKENVALVERRGAIGGVQVRNIIAPARNEALIVFTNRADLSFGEIWQGDGLSHDLLSAAFCGSAPAAK
jgi:D-alanyl-D-alanine carboxypeptidase